VGYIYYRLTNAASLQNMAPAALMGGGFAAAALPPGMAGFAGMYIIINCIGATENRYIGISQNIGNRFSTRMSVVTELGFPTATMAQIYVVWGTVRVRNHPHGLAAAQAPLTPVLYGGPPANIAFPNWGAGGWANPVPAGGGAAFTAMIDGNLINLEHLLIRFVMMRLGAGGTVSNNVLMAPFNHPNGLGVVGAQPLIVKFQSAPFGNYNGFVGTDILSPGFQW
jgi:hypothetical protein